MAVEWTDRAIQPAPRLGPERVAEIQQRLGITFPDDYIDVVRTHQGAAPERNSVTLPDGSTTTFSMLLHFEDQPEGLDVFGILEWSEVLPGMVIPFGVDPGDNYFCFDYRAAQANPPVTFMVTDDPDAEPEFLVDSFTELIESLQAG